MLVVDFVLGLLFELMDKLVNFLPKFYLLHLNEIIILHLKVGAMLKEVWILCWQLFLSLAFFSILWANKLIFPPNSTYYKLMI